MTEWEVFGVIVALIAFVGTVVAPIIKLNTSITKLTTIIDRMAEDLSVLTDKNSVAHTAMQKQLNDHETRLTVLERS